MHRAQAILFWRGGGSRHGNFVINDSQQSQHRARRQHWPETLGTCGPHGLCHESRWWERLPADMPDPILNHAMHGRSITAPNDGEGSREREEYHSCKGCTAKPETVFLKQWDEQYG